MSGSFTQTNPTIIFNEIPYATRVPGVNVEVRPNYSNIGLVSFPASLLLIGQAFSTATATAATPYLITSADQATTLFGAGSMLEDMVRTALAAAPTNTVTAMGVYDAAGAVAATGSITISGTPTAAGTIAMYVRGIRIAIPVAANDSMATIQASLTAAVAAVNAGPGLQLPVTFGAGTISGSLTVPITARHKGLCGFDIDVRFNILPGEAFPPGLVATFVGWSAAATNPSIAAALTAVANTWFTDIAIGWNDSANLALFTAELNRRYGAMVKLDCTGYVAFRGTLGTLATAASTLNCPFLVAPGLQNPVSPGWVIASSLAAVACLNLSGNDPARQMRGLVLPGVIGSAPADRFAEYPDENNLLFDGIAVLHTRPDWSVICTRIITTYQNNAGVADAAWLDVMVPKTMTRIRYDWRSYVQLAYPRNKLADDGALAAAYDTSIVTPKRMRASWAGRCRLYERYGWIENADTTAASAQFTRDATDRNRLNARQQLRIIGNLMVLDGVLEFAA